MAEPTALSGCWRFQQLEEFEASIRRLVERHMELASAESHHYFELLDALADSLRSVEMERKE